MTDLRYLLAIYVHAHQTGNSVPPHIDAEARAALAAERPAPGPTIDDIWQLCEDHEFHLGMDGANEEESAEGLLEIINTALGRWGRPAPVPAADGKRDHVPGAGNMVAADGEAEELATLLAIGSSCAAGAKLSPEQCRRAAALLSKSKITNQKARELAATVQAAYSAYGWVPEDQFNRLFDEVARVADVMEEGCDCSLQGPLDWQREIEKLKSQANPPSANGEAEELAQWLDGEAKSCAAQFHDRITRAAVLLQQAAPASVQGWQPINTAPQDGTEILASDYDAIEIVSWSWDAWETGSGWIDRNGQRMFPAWWQPLQDHPPIPQSPQAGEVRQ